MSVTYFSYLNVKIDFSMKTDRKQRPFVATFKFNKRRILTMQSKRINIKKLTVKRSLKNQRLRYHKLINSRFPKNFAHKKRDLKFHGLIVTSEFCLRYT